MMEILNSKYYYYNFFCTKLCLFTLYLWRYKSSYLYFTVVLTLLADLTPFLCVCARYLTLHEIYLSGFYLKIGTFPQYLVCDWKTHFGRRLVLHNFFLHLNVRILEKIEGNLSVHAWIHVDDWSVLISKCFHLTKRRHVFQKGYFFCIFNEFGYYGYL